MTASEARWLGSVLSDYSPDELTPLLNIGSSDAFYRASVCPEIDKSVFLPLQARGIKVWHSDVKNAIGVDLVGDIFDPAVFKRLQSIGSRALVCSNVIEHVADPIRLVHLLVDLMPKGSLLFLTVPYHYPYHPDPLDNLFRVSLQGLTEFVRPYFALERGLEIQTGSYLQSLLEKKWLVARDALLVLKAVRNVEKRRVLFSNYAYFKRKFATSCGVFRRV